MNGKNFAITGAAGYIAPRHLKAIKETGNILIAAVDPHDSVGILDQYFPDCAFFTEIERFDRHLEMLKRKRDGIDFLAICSPNHLHDSHIRLALRLGADAICEKPLVLNPWNLDALQKLEEESGRKIYTILQLRVHPALIELKRKFDTQHSFVDNRALLPVSRTKHQVILSYVTSRGPWYKYSWKGDPQKSGGIATNIGIHFFDLLIWLFGKVEKIEVHLSEENKMAGFLELENANVNWFLSIDKNDIAKLNLSSRTETTHNSLITPVNVQRTFRSIKIDDEEINFTEGFTDLHTKVYERIISDKSFGIDDARNSIELVYRLRKHEEGNTTLKRETPSILKYYR